MAGVEVEGDMVICVIRQGSDGARLDERGTGEDNSISVVSSEVIVAEETRSGIKDCLAADFQC